MRGEGGKVDIYGVGTKLATCAGEGGGALGGIYKLVRIGDEPKLKVTSDVSKATLPDKKSLVRAVAPGGEFLMDIISLPGEHLKQGDLVFDPTNPLRHTFIPENAILEELRTVVMGHGKRTGQQPSLDEMADRSKNQL